MPQKKHKPEEIVAKLRQVDVLVSQGQSVAEAVRSISVTQFTYYRWRKEFGGLVGPFQIQGQAKNRACRPFDVRAQRGRRRVHENDSTRHGFHLDSSRFRCAFPCNLCDGVPMEPGLFDLLIDSASIGFNMPAGRLLR